MGGDGGSIPKRVDIVKTKGYKFVRNLGGMGYNPNLQARASDERFGRAEERSLRWSTCAISQQPLRPPIAACKLGNLYNKQTLLEGLIHKKLPSHVAHVKTSKDFKECKTGCWKLDDESDPRGSGHFVCSVIDKRLDGCCGGVMLWSCGCVFSRKALEMNDTGTGSSSSIESTGRQECISCGCSYEEEDVLTLVPAEEEMKSMRDSLAQFEEKKRLSKRLKSDRHKGGDDGEGQSRERPSVGKPSAVSSETKRELSPTEVGDEETSPSVLSSRDSKCLLGSAYEAHRSKGVTDKGVTDNVSGNCKVGGAHKADEEVTGRPVNGTESKKRAR